MNAKTIERIEGVLEELDRLEPLCREGLLRHLELKQLLRQFESRFEGVLPQNSLPYRIYSSKRQAEPRYLNWAGEFVSPADVVHLQKWRAIALAVLCAVDPASQHLKLDRPVAPVTSPSIKAHAASVERTIIDAELLLRNSGAARGVDRVHTALHGYILAIASEAGISIPENASLTAAFKALRVSHPAIAPAHLRGGDIDKILRSCSSILDALNPVRNLASAAHPNECLLEPAEAMLVINVARTMLAYLDAKLYP